MNPLLISGFGTSINVDKRRLVVTNKLENTRLEFWPHQIPHDSIIIDGHYGSVSFEALRWLAKHDIPLVLLNWNGNLLSATLPREPISGKLKVKQYESYLDQTKRSYITYAIIEEKVKKSLNLLRELGRFYKSIDLDAINRAFSRERSMSSRKSIKETMTFEGRIATIYWSYLNKVFAQLCPELNFQSRQNRRYREGMNASDAINAMLNYGYALLEAEIRKDVNVIGLDLNVGFLHEINPSKMPLAYDCQELYRWIVDKSVIDLLEERDIKSSDFITTENYHIRLREAAVKKLISKLSLNMNKRVPYKGQKYTYQVILQEQIRKIANYILGKSTVLSFDTPEICLERSDPLDVQKVILSTTPEEQKLMGMSKSGLWYRKRKILEGKMVKIYAKTRMKMSRKSLDLLER